MIILGVECTAGPVSCAVYENGSCKAEYYLNIKTTHSQTLMPMIESSFSLCGLTPQDIDYYAVTDGPGSFTGVRIGVSAVKGLAQPIGKPCVAVSVLEAMAYNMLSTDCVVCSVMDARCNQVYNGLFEVCSGRVERLSQDRALMIDELKSEIINLSQANTKTPIFIVGDGAELFYKSVQDIPNVKLAPPQLVRQKASGVCLVAENKIKRNETVSANELLPRYLRKPQAERELNAKMQKKG